MLKKEQDVMKEDLEHLSVKDKMMVELSKLMLVVGSVTAIVIIFGLGVITLWEMLLK